MRCTSVVRVALGAVLVLWVVSSTGNLPAAAAETGKAGAAPAEAGPAKKLTGRLPNYYREVVDDAQRAKILELQQQYNAKIGPLEQEVERLKQERDAKIEGVLTPDQKKKLEAIKAAAKKARDAKSSSKKGQGAATPVAPK